MKRLPRASSTVPIGPRIQHSARRECADFFEQFIEIERLDQAIHEYAVRSARSGLVDVMGCHEQNGNGVAGMSDRLTDLEAVPTAEIQIYDHNIELIRAQMGEAFMKLAGELERVMLGFESALHETHHSRIVFDKQNTHHRTLDTAHGTIENTWWTTMCRMIPKLDERTMRET